MKISKLFHWLYAFLMFLPIVLFIPNALYYGFNEHATNSETTTINYKYQSNEVNSVDDLVQGNVYHMSIIDNSLDSWFTPGQSYSVFTILKVYSYDLSNYVNDISLDEIFDNGELEGTPIVKFYISDNDLKCYLTTFLTSASEDGFSTFYLGELTEYQFTLDCVVQINYINGIYDIEDLFEYTDYNVIESVEINTNDTISNKMYQAWQSTWNLPLLQWTHTSFVAQPFTYITGLFGVPSDSTFNYLFAYFVSISICWLVFDLLMYVPNLAHRWLDKGALE